MRYSVKFNLLCPQCGFSGEQEEKIDSPSGQEAVIQVRSMAFKCPNCKYDKPLKPNGPFNFGVLEAERPAEYVKRSEE